MQPTYWVFVSSAAPSTKNSRADRLWELRHRTHYCVSTSDRTKRLGRLAYARLTKLLELCIQCISYTHLRLQNVLYWQAQSRPHPSNGILRSKVIVLSIPVHWFLTTLTLLWHPRDPLCSTCSTPLPWYRNPRCLLTPAVLPWQRNLRCTVSCFILVATSPHHVVESGVFCWDGVWVYTSSGRRIHRLRQLWVKINHCPHA